ncbi:MAG: HEAT repeat domain-containing protein [Planctomycetes bacterium]|nr:HEAT repeat domain-containing protein [Planctomycetota bacterium]
MRAITLVLTFATVVAAQDHRTKSSDPNTEIANAIAFEEQERDLAKAEKAYREAAADTKISEEARQVAAMRLIKLLRSLGREKDAEDAARQLLRVETGLLGVRRSWPAATLDDITPSPQDAEREAELRARAEELVRSYSSSGPSTVPQMRFPELMFVPQDIGQQLLWIGEPAAPVLVATLESMLAGGSYQPDRVKGLAGVLWRIGGPVAARFLGDRTKDPEVAHRVLLVATAFQCERPEMRAVAARFLRDPDDSVFATLVGGRFSPQPDPRFGRAFPFEPGVLLDACSDGPAGRRAWLLDQAASWRADAIGPELVERLVPVADAATRSTDPALGSAAQHFLASTLAQGSPSGMKVLLRELPRLAAAGVRVGPAPSAAVPPASRFTKQQATELLPVLDECIASLPPGPFADDPWLTSLAGQVVAATDADVAPRAAAWLERGRTAPWILADKLSAQNCRSVVAAFERAPRKQLLDYAYLFSTVDLPRDLFPVVHARLADSSLTDDVQKKRWIAMALARTGAPEAAEWLSNNSIDGLFELGRRCADEPVRKALWTVLEATQGEPTRASCALALLAMHDVKALAWTVRVDQPGPSIPHPYARAERPAATTPLRYVVERDPDPPHGFSDDEVAAAFASVAAEKVPASWVSLHEVVGAMPARLVADVAGLVFASEDRSESEKSDWVRAALWRLRDPAGPLAGWPARGFDESRGATRAELIRLLEESEVASLRERLERCVDGDDESCAFEAVRALAGVNHPFDLARLAKNRHSRVREHLLEHLLGGVDRVVAEDLAVSLLEDPDERVRMEAIDAAGRMVSTNAVPKLIGLLRDNESYAREQAAAALTKIRFQHETQGYWDRVVKGLDASPTSAAEKLLLQAKPGAAKAQRLLAIKSLGTLGVPEALPFLIDWSGDTDPEVAAAANAAITAIHLNPRR